MLSSVAALPSRSTVVPSEMREHVYEIESVVHLPKHGTHRFYTRLRLSEHSEASEGLAGGV